MADDKALMYYQSTMRIARQWLGSGLITVEDYEKFDTIVAESITRKLCRIDSRLRYTE